MQITKNKILNFFLILALFFTLTQVILTKSVQADADLLNKVQQGGLDEFGQEVYGTTNPTDVRIIVALIIKVFLGFLGIIFLGIVIFAGFKWMTAGGNEEYIGEAKKMMKNGIIGLIIIFLSYAVADMTMDCLWDAAVGNTIWFCK